MECENAITDLFIKYWTGLLHIVLGGSSVLTNKYCKEAGTRFNSGVAPVQGYYMSRQLIVGIDIHYVQIYTLVLVIWVGY